MAGKQEQNHVAIGMRVQGGNRPRVFIRARCSCGSCKEMQLPVSVQLPCTGCAHQGVSEQFCLGCSRYPKLEDRWRL